MDDIGCKVSAVCRPERADQIREFTFTTSLLARGRLPTTHTVSAARVRAPQQPNPEEIQLPFGLSFSRAAEEEMPFQPPAAEAPAQPEEPFQPPAAEAEAPVAEDRDPEEQTDDEARRDEEEWAADNAQSEAEDEVGEDGRMGDEASAVRLRPRRKGLIDYGRAPTSRATCFICSLQIPQTSWRVEYCLRPSHAMRDFRFAHASCARFLHLMKYHLRQHLQLNWVRSWAS